MFNVGDKIQFIGETNTVKNLIKGKIYTVTSRCGKVCGDEVISVRSHDGRNFMHFEKNFKLYNCVKEEW